jgi:MFS family permease
MQKPTALSTEKTKLPRPQRSLWRNRDYMLLLSGEIVSSIGSQASGLALPLLVLALTGSDAQAGFVGSVRLLPYLLLSLPVGVLVDRWDRKRVMILCDTGRALSLASIPIALAFNHLTLVQIYLVTLIEGTLFVFFNIAEVSCLPYVVSKEQLPKAVAQNTFTLNASFLIGPTLGGILFGIDHRLPFVLDAVSYAASVFSLLFISTAFQGERLSKPRKLLVELREGLHWLWNQRFIRTIALLASGNTVLVAGTALMIIVLATQKHIPTAVLGLVLAAGGIGGALGALSASYILKRVTFGQVLIATSWLWTLFFPLYLIAPNAFALGGVFFISAAALSIYDVGQFSYRLTLIPGQLTGRVNSVFRLISFSGQPLGLALTGELLQTVNIAPTVLVLTTGLILLAIVRTLNPHIRAARTLPSA